MKPFAQLGIWAASVLLLGCESKPIALDVVHSSNQCDAIRPGLVRLENADQVSQAITNHSRFAPQQDTPAVSEADLRERLFVLVSMGAKPTAGYRFRVEDKAPEIQGDTLVLPISYVEPGENSQAQVMSNPCLVVSVDRGEYRAIRVQNLRLDL